MYSHCNVFAARPHSHVAKIGSRDADVYQVHLAATQGFDSAITHDIVSSNNALDLHAL